jgi:hypothetical protein
VHLKITGYPLNLFLNILLFELVFLDLWTVHLSAVKNDLNHKQSRSLPRKEKPEMAHAVESIYSSSNDTFTI